MQSLKKCCTIVAAVSRGILEQKAYLWQNLVSWHHKNEQNTTHSMQYNKNVPESASNESFISTWYQMYSGHVFRISEHLLLQNSVAKSTQSDQKLSCNLTWAHKSSMYHRSSYHTNQGKRIIQVLEKTQQGTDFHSLAFYSHVSHHFIQDISKHMGTSISIKSKF